MPERIFNESMGQGKTFCCCCFFVVLDIVAIFLWDNTSFFLGMKDLESVLSI